MIAIGLACNPKLIIADEPTTALDVTIQAQILELMKDLSRRLGIALIIITHNLGIVARYADRVNVMYAARIIEQGTADDVFLEPAHPYTIGLMRSIPRLDLPRGVQARDDRGPAARPAQRRRPAAASRRAVPIGIDACTQQRRRSRDDRAGPCVGLHPRQRDRRRHAGAAARDAGRAATAALAQTRRRAAARRRSSEEVFHREGRRRRLPLVARPRP